jgi:hypothetical protein
VGTPSARASSWRSAWKTCTPAQDQARRDRLSAQLLGGHRKGYRPGGTGRRWQVVVGGAAAERAQGRSAGHGQDNGRGYRRRHDLLPVLPRAGQLPGTHLRLRGARGHGKDPQGNRVCHRGAQARTVETATKSKTLSRDAWLERKTPVNPTQFVQIQSIEGEFNELGSSHHRREYSTARRPRSARRRRRDRHFNGRPVRRL